MDRPLPPMDDKRGVYQTYSTGLERAAGEGRDSSALAAALVGTTIGHYRIEGLEGSGGMGVVFRAHDPGLERDVAIKFLPPDLTDDKTAKQRFLQEAKAASALDHPNICTIHEINETADGQQYLVMAHYQGESLKERIARGRLELHDAIDIATQVGEKLAKAHAAGIVHRDIKPANLIVTTDGTVKILDFGLAKLAGCDVVTKGGAIVGTVAYMSPEQVRGEPVDHRTDIWSLGALLHEMLAGTPPFRGDNLLSISNAIVGQTPPALSGSSSAAQAVTARALHKQRTQRFQSAAELVAALHDLRQHPHAPTGLVDLQLELPSIAVLPFTNMSNDPDQDYFCDGLAEELIDALARLDGLQVVGRTSSFQYRGKGYDLRQIGEELGVTTVLEGSVRKAGNRLRVNVQLINASNGYHLWSERYDRELAEVFDMQDEIARSVVENLKVELIDPGSLARRQTNLEAYEIFLRGRHFLWKFTLESLDKAKSCFVRALRQQPDYAEALAYKAVVYQLRSVLGAAPPRKLMPQAKHLACSALAINDRLPEAHLSLALVEHSYGWDWAETERRYVRAIKLNSRLSDAYAPFAVFLAQMGRSGEAITQAANGVRLNPIDPYANYALSYAYYYGERFHDARDQAQRALELETTYIPSYWQLASAHASLGDPEEALKVCALGLDLAEDDPILLSRYGALCAKLNKRREASKALKHMHQLRRAGYFPAFNIACYYEGVGDTEQAIKWVNAAYRERDGLCCAFATYDLLAPLRSDPRFQALLRKMKFPQVPGN